MFFSTCFWRTKTWFKIRTSGSSSVICILYIYLLLSGSYHFTDFSDSSFIFSPAKKIYTVLYNSCIHLCPWKKKNAKRHHRGVGGFQVTQKKVWLNDWGTKSTMTLPAFMDATASLVISNGEGLVAEIRFVHGFFVFFGTDNWWWQ